MKKNEYSEFFEFEADSVINLNSFKKHNYYYFAPYMNIHTKNLQKKLSSYVQGTK